MADGLGQRPPVQSRGAAKFSRFSKNIPKPFIMYNHKRACEDELKNFVSKLMNFA